MTLYGSCIITYMNTKKMIDLKHERKAIYFNLKYNTHGSEAYIYAIPAHKWG